MVFKTYLHLLIPISIQNVSEFGETETKSLVALTYRSVYIRSFMTHKGQGYLSPL